MSTSSEKEFQDILNQISVPHKKTKVLPIILIASAVLMIIAIFYYPTSKKLEKSNLQNNYPIALRVDLTSHLDSTKSFDTFVKASLYSGMALVLTDVLIKIASDSSNGFLIRIKREDLNILLPYLKNNSSLRALPINKEQRNCYEIAF